MPVKQMSESRVLFLQTAMLAIGLVLLSGIVYRVLELHFVFTAQADVQLPVKLSTFPKEIDGWTGSDIPLSENILKVAGNDDYLYRFFECKSTDQWTIVYVAYSAHPRTMLGHNPRVCYVTNGWIYESGADTSFLCRDGSKQPCVIYRFHKYAPDYQEIVVLNYYILNGIVISSEKGFSGLGWRMPNIGGKPANYVAQVQIASVFENSVRKAAEDIGGLILKFFPDENGVVGIAEGASIY